jgi:hypothetical protein
MSPFGVTVEVISRVRGQHGDTTRVPKGSIAGCGFAPSSSTEDNDRKAQVDTTASLYIPPGSLAVSAQDVIRFPNGDEWQVDGEPLMWFSPLTGWAPGGEVRIRRVTG